LVSAAKQKGSDAERELAKLLVAAGLTEAKRTPLSGALSDWPGDIVLDGFAVECKRQETTSIWKWWAQACAAARGGRHPILFFRRNHSDWLVTLDAKTWAGEQAELRAARNERSAT
jgi:Holliday junction resolvase